MYPITLTFFTTKYPKLKAFFDEKDPARLKRLVRELQPTYLCPDTKLGIETPLHTLSIILSLGSFNHVVSYLGGTRRLPALYLWDMLLNRDEILPLLKPSFEVTLTVEMVYERLSEYLQHAISTFPMEALQHMRANLLKIYKPEHVLAFFKAARTIQQRILYWFQTNMQYVVEQFRSSEMIDFTKYPQHPLFLTCPINHIEEALQDLGSKEPTDVPPHFLWDALREKYMLQAILPDSLNQHPILKEFLGPGLFWELELLVNDLKPTYTLEVQLFKQGGKEKEAACRKVEFSTGALVVHFGSMNHILTYAKSQQLDFPLEKDFFIPHLLLFCPEHFQGYSIQKILGDAPVWAVFIAEIERMRPYQEALLNHLSHDDLSSTEYNLFAFLPILALQIKRCRDTIEKISTVIEGVTIERPLDAFFTPTSALLGRVHLEYQ